MKFKWKCSRCDEESKKPFKTANDAGRNGLLNHEHPGFVYVIKGDKYVGLAQGLNFHSLKLFSSKVKVS